MDLGNALNHWTYAGNGNLERRRLIYARKRSRSLLSWLFDHWELVDANDNPIDGMQEFYWPLLAQRAKALVRYKEAALANNIQGRFVTEKCTFKAVKEAVESSVMTPPELWDLYCKPTSTGDELTPGQNANASFDCTFAWKGPRFDVRKIVNPPMRKSEKQ